MRSRRDYLFPVRVMGALFRGKMLAALRRAHGRRQLDLGSVDLEPLHRTRWVVYAKRPFGGPQQVVRYLGRYTHRVGLSNQRLLSMDEQGVTFRTRDGKSTTLPGDELLARFVQHVLPPGYVKIRHYGLHAACNATTRLELARQRLTPGGATESRPEQPPPAEDWRPLMLRLSGVDVRVCPACRLHTLERCALAAPRGRAPPVPS